MQTTNGVDEDIIMINLGQGHLLTLAGLSSIQTFQRSSSLNQSEILCGASMGRGNKLEFDREIRIT